MSVPADPRDIDALSFAEAAEMVRRVGPLLVFGPLLMGASIWRNGRPLAGVVWTVATIALSVVGVGSAYRGERPWAGRSVPRLFALAAGAVGACWGVSAFLLDADTPAGAISRVIPPIAVIAMMSVIFAPYRPSLIAGVAGVAVPYAVSFGFVDRRITVESLPGFLTVTTVFVLHALGEGNRRRAAIAARLADAEAAEGLRRDRADALATNAELRAVNEHVLRLAERDALTGAYNRRVLVDRLTAIAPHERPRHVLVLIDLDHFKDANDRYGHAVGDEILCHLARAAEELLHEPGYFTRWGGEEFALLLHDHDEDRVVALLHELRRELQLRLPAGVVSSFSAGTARWEHGLEMADVLRRADIALYAAKANGRGRTEVFRDELRSALAPRL